MPTEVQSVKNCKKRRNVDKKACRISLLFVLVFFPHTTHTPPTHSLHTLTAHSIRTLTHTHK
jgi:hypothetical protein